MEVWQKAHQFVLDVYKYTKEFPKEEVYALTSQFRRAAISIPANISEGYPKQSLKDKIRFYEYAQSSMSECEYYLILSEDLGYGDNSKLKDMLSEISKMLTSYILKIKKSSEYK